MNFNVGACVVAGIAALATVIIHKDAQNASIQRKSMDQDITSTIQKAMDGMGQGYTPGPEYWDKKVMSAPINQNNTDTKN